MSDHSHIMKKDNAPYPGVYICGQDALNKASHLKNYLDTGDLMSKMVIEMLIEQLESCYVSQGDS